MSLASSLRSLEKALAEERIFARWLPPKETQFRELEYARDGEVIAVNDQDGLRFVPYVGQLLRALIAAHGAMVRVKPRLRHWQ
jgi:hypothetical protein